MNSYIFNIYFPVNILSKQNTFCFQIKVNRDANRIITLTRNAIGFWNLENGALEGTVAEKPLGGKKNIKLWSKISN